MGQEDNESNLLCVAALARQVWPCDDLHAMQHSPLWSALVDEEQRGGGGPGEGAGEQGGRQPNVDFAPLRADMMATTLTHVVCACGNLAETLHLTSSSSVASQ